MYRAPLGFTNVMFAYDQSQEAVEAKIEPLMQYLRGKNSSIKVDHNIKTYPK